MALIPCREDSSDKEFMKTFTSLFGDVDSTELPSMRTCDLQEWHRAWRMPTT